MNPRNFFAELKRRNVYKVAVAYAVVSWLLIQAASIVLPTFEAPAWMMKVLLVALVIGFPIAVVLAWAFEITPEGIVRAEDVAPNESITYKTGRKLVSITVALAVIAAGLLAFQFLRPKSARMVAAPTTTVAPTAPPETSTSPEKSIAVLPFENLSDDKQNSFFTDGVQDEILTDLAKVADLKVISRTSVMQYKTGTRNLQEIARALKVSHVVEGTVQRSANRVRVTAQLIDARNDSHLWAEKYDRELADVFAIQSEIAQKIADQLQAKLSPNEKAAIQQRPTSDLVAFELYQRAISLRSAISSDAEVRDKSPEVLRLLEQAVARDPAFLLAYCAIAGSHDRIYFAGIDHTPARLALAEAAVRRALELEPDSGEAHLARARHLYQGYLDYEGALAELTIARRTLPNNSGVLVITAYVQRRQGRFDEATRNLEYALELDPLHQGRLTEIAVFYAMQRRYQECIRTVERVLALNPQNDFFNAMRWFVLFEKKGETSPFDGALPQIIEGRPNAAATVSGPALTIALCERDRAAAEKALAMIPLDGYAAGDDGDLFPRGIAQGLFGRTFGEATAAQAGFQAAHDELQKRVSAQPDNDKALIVLSIADAGLGRKEEAIREARHAFELRPIAKDQLEGAKLMYYLALVYAWTGERDLAIEQLSLASKLPSPASYGDLKLNPQWDPLRGDPRFDEITASLAPKGAKP